MLLISGEPAGSWHTIYKYINHEKGVMQTVSFLVLSQRNGTQSMN